MPMPSVAPTRPFRDRGCHLPDSSDGHSNRLSIGLANGLDDHPLIIENQVTTGPEPRAHAHPKPAGVGGVALFRAIDAGLAANVVIGVRR